MILSRLAASVRDLVVLTGLLLFAVLFLDWREVSVRTAAVTVDSGASAWGVWGTLAGVLLIAFVVLDVPAGRPAEAAGIALLASAFTVVEFFTGSAHVDVTGVLSVSTEQRLWPAYVGLGLAVVLAAGAAVRLVAQVRDVAEPTGTASQGLRTSPQPRS